MAAISSPHAISLIAPGPLVALTWPHLQTACLQQRPASCAQSSVAHACHCTCQSRCPFVQRRHGLQPLLTRRKDVLMSGCHLSSRLPLSSVHRPRRRGRATRRSQRYHQSHHWLKTRPRRLLRSSGRWTEKRKRQRRMRKRRKSPAQMRRLALMRGLLCREGCLSFLR